MAVNVTVAKTKGSTPRDIGAQMLVWQDGQSGTIGGGALEYQATKHARRMLVSQEIESRLEQALGPELGQCCGGHVVLDFKRVNKQLTAIQNAQPVWIFGAGHVGRALANVLAPFGEYSITLVETETARLPNGMPENITTLTNSDMAAVVAKAPTDALHYIMTMSHAIDLDLCDTLLKHGFGFAGLIGSKTKWARFQARLSEWGHSAEQISRITCPIGDPILGKEPQAIAVGIAHGLLLERAEVESAASTTG